MLESPQPEAVGYIAYFKGHCSPSLSRAGDSKPAALSNLSEMRVVADMTRVARLQRRSETTA